MTAKTCQRSELQCSRQLQRYATEVSERHDINPMRRQRTRTQIRFPSYFGNLLLMLVISMSFNSCTAFSPKSRDNLKSAINTCLERVPNSDCPYRPHGTVQDGVKRVLAAVEGISKFNLWLVPSEPFRKAVDRVITRLSTQYGRPSFPPHVTIGNSFRTNQTHAISIAKAVAAAFWNKKIPLVPRSVYVSTYHFRLCALPLDTNGGLLKAQIIADRLTPPVAKEIAYHPHMSLMYGDLDMEQLQGLKRQLEEEIFGGGGGPLSTGANASELWLVATEGLEWRCWSVLLKRTFVEDTSE